jgi:hypothetical protein
MVQGSASCSVVQPHFIISFLPSPSPSNRPNHNRDVFSPFLKKENVVPHQLRLLQALFLSVVMPSWMLEGFSTWNGSQLCMTPVISRALMLDIKQTELTITNLENMQQLVAIRLSMQSTRCVVKGLFMAFQCQEVHRRGNICARLNVTFY